MKSLTPSPKVILTETREGGVLLDLDTKFYFTLNAMGVALWKRLQAGGATLDALGSALTEEFDVDAETARRDAAEVLRELVAEGLVREA